MTQSPGNSRTVRLIAGAAIGLVGLLGLSIYLAGCNETPRPTDGSNGKTTSTQDDERCDNLLDNALDMLRADRLRITAKPETAVGLLNQWLMSCGTPGGDRAAADPAVKALRTKRLSEEEIGRTTQPRFGLRDANHIRDGLLHKTTVRFAVRSAGNDLERVVQLFDYVVRNVRLLAADSERIPLTPFHVLMFGEGTAEDRAWIFADLLRQLRIDAVILRPKSPAGKDDPQPAERRWLVGVLLDGKVHLFDTRLGWPVPSARDDPKTPTVRQPATLSEAMADAGVFERLDVDDERPYPLRAEDLKSLCVELIGDTGFWSARMKRLQRRLSGARSVVISDPLEDGPAGDGLVARVVTFGKGKWPAEDVAIWPYPERQLHGFANLEESQSDKLHVRELPFGAPAPLAADPKTKTFVLAGKPMRTQLKTRTSHLLGDHRLAIKAYLSIRLGGEVARMPAPPMIRHMHAEAAEDAFFWIGLCQFEQETFDTAAATFRDYLRRYSGGKWAGLARGLLALHEAERGDLTRAVEILQAVPKGDPHRDGYDLLIRRWREESEESSVESREPRD